MVYLSYGTTINPDGYAIQDFEMFDDGEVTNLNQHVTTNGDVRFLETTIIDR